ncbi:MAG: FAD-dependent oxidoreductase [Deltaproteobacteria bacterium]|nr:FAD-dependent oxidoreductase [Deltaproteobacteria bacterium]
MRAEPSEVVILGGGLTGISAARHLTRSWILLEKEARLGGHARTDERDGYHFDKTGHWLHLRDPYTKNLIADLLGDKMVPVERRARIFANGALTRYPFQANLYGQPPEVVKECLVGFVLAWRRRQDPQAGAPLPPPANFEDFIHREFGAGIARHFMIPYNHKLWGVHPREITSAWCTRFVPIPKLEEVVAGAVGANPPEMGYNVSFLYPREGGIETMTRALAHGLVERGEVRTGTSPDAIDVAARAVEVGGERIPYRALVATLPLPDLLRRIRGMPASVELAATRLRATPVRYLNVATKSSPPVDYHWIYAPEEKYPFYRAGIYSNAVPSMAPPGRGSLYVELSERGPFPTGAERDTLNLRVAQGLVEAGAIKSPDDLLFMDLHELPHAYVVFDDHYYDATDTIRRWLEANGIYPRGRYGSWTYNSMEDCILAGREVAELLNARLGEVSAQAIK